jgi:hypothetical protein
MNIFHRNFSLLQEFPIEGRRGENNKSWEKKENFSWGKKEEKRTTLQCHRTPTECVTEEPEGIVFDLALTLESACEEFS